MKFIGVDFGWVSQPSGLCCLAWQEGKLRLLDLNRLLGVAEVLAWIANWTPNSTPAMVAVDAPTLIPNPTGMRSPDKLTHKYFGRYDAGCYPANQSRPYAQRTIDFGLSLEAQGFAHAPTIVPQQPGRYQIEVFPHPAIVHLFGLERILKYKKGRLSDRAAQLAKLYKYVVEVLPNCDPPLYIPSSNNLLSPVPNACTGAALKAIEDRLDSLICAYVAAYWWYWGSQRNWVLGDRASGYIVVPAPSGDLSRLQDIMGSNSS